MVTNAFRASIAALLMSRVLFPGILMGVFCIVDVDHERKKNLSINLK